MTGVYGVAVSTISCRWCLERKGKVRDCNGPVMDGNSVWFQISRVDDCFAFHYSVDGLEYNMVRVFTLPVGQTVKVGFEAQAPMGEGGNRYYSEISIQNK